MNFTPWTQTRSFLFFPPLLAQSFTIWQTCCYHFQSVVNCCLCWSLSHTIYNSRLSVSMVCCLNHWFVYWLCPGLWIDCFTCAAFRFRLRLRETDAYITLYTVRCSVTLIFIRKFTPYRRAILFLQNIHTVLQGN